MVSCTVYIIENTYVAIGALPRASLVACGVAVTERALIHVHVHFTWPWVVPVAGTGSGTTHLTHVSCTAVDHSRCVCAVILCCVQIRLFGMFPAGILQYWYSSYATTYEYVSLSMPTIARVMHEWYK